MFCSVPACAKGSARRQPERRLQGQHQGWAGVELSPSKEVNHLGLATATKPSGWGQSPQRSSPFNRSEFRPLSCLSLFRLSGVSAGIKCPHFRWFCSQKVRWFCCWRARPQRRLRRSKGVALLGAGFPNSSVLGQRQPSRAVSRNRSGGKPLVLGVRLDRFDHQVECTGTVDLACHTIRPMGRKAEAFCEVEQAIHALSVAMEMPGSPLKLAAPVQPTLRRLSFFDNLRFRRCQRF